MRVRVFLRQPLFTLPGAEHVPPTAWILDGSLGESSQLGAVLTVERYLDEKGRALDGKPARLVVPGAKIDHVQVLD
jgi:hypothetical protein